MKPKRLVKKSQISGKNRKLNTNFSETWNDGKKELGVLYRAQQAWDALHHTREERHRNIRYTYGDQYSDIVTVDGDRMTEAAYWAQQGVIPKKNNLIGKMVRSVIGVFKNQGTDFRAVALDREEQSVAEMMSATLQANRDINLMNELELSLFREFLISASVYVKEEWGWKKRRKDSWTSIVNNDNIFHDGKMEDVRHWDCDIIGQIHDMTLQEVKSVFAKNPKDAQVIEDLYAHAVDDEYLQSNYLYIYNSRRNQNGSFYTPSNANLCRVIEVWTLEHRPIYRCHDYMKGEYFEIAEEDIDLISEENGRRRNEYIAEGIEEGEIPYIEAEWVIAPFWYYRFMSPLGDVFQEGETPFDHKEHPYTMKIYPFLDGKPHSLVEDSIDQQKFVNELITLYMLMAKHSAKGLLMFPEQLLGDTKPEEIAEEYAKFNGMLVYKAKPGVELPQQLSTNIQNFNVAELLQMEMNMFEEVTGVTGALVGKNPASGIAASLYAQQSQNASNTLVDILFAFSNFLKSLYNKKLSNINQFYTEKRLITVAGSKYKGITQYLPDLAKDTTFDIIIEEGLGTPEYKQSLNDMLLGMLQLQIVDGETVLEFGEFPKGKELLAAIKKKQEEAAAAQAQNPQQ